MNYRHAYHAGNFADVFKHAALAILLQHLRKKAKGFCVIDSHAGVGRYDLAGPEASKTLEWQEGVAAAMAAPEVPILAPWRDVIADLNPNGGCRHYPGSPLVARHFLRPQDRLIVAELHPQDRRALATLFEGDKQVLVRPADGYATLIKQIPPFERRGVALIDPPFERPDEWEVLIEVIAEAHAKWATGTYVVWYPVKDLTEVARFHDVLASLAIPKTLIAEFHVRPPAPDVFFGSGLAVINPPWQWDEDLRALGAALAVALNRADAQTIVEWLVPETA